MSATTKIALARAYARGYVVRSLGIPDAQDFIPSDLGELQAFAEGVSDAASVGPLSNTYFIAACNAVDAERAASAAADAKSV